MSSKRLLAGEFDELLRMIRKRSIKDALVLCLLHDSAMRIEDALCVQLHHFSPDHSLVRVEDGKWRKDGKHEPDTLPVSPRTTELLKLYLEQRVDGARVLITSSAGNKMHQQHYRRLLAREGKRVLGKHVYPHMLRHTSITEAACGVRGVKPALPLPVVQKFARHRNLKTTQSYVHVDETWAHDMRDWMAG